MPEITFKVLHDCGVQCSMCSGSGEGMADGTTCRFCQGMGTDYPPGFNWKNSEHEAAVEVDLDYPIEEQYWECPRCGMDITEDVREELKHMKS